MIITVLLRGGTECPFIHRFAWFLPKNHFTEHIGIMNNSPCKHICNINQHSLERLNRKQQKVSVLKSGRHLLMRVLTWERSAKEHYIYIHIYSLSNQNGTCVFLSVEKTKKRCCVKIKPQLHKHAQHTALFVYTYTWRIGSGESLSNRSHPQLLMLIKTNQIWLYIVHVDTPSVQ